MKTMAQSPHAGNWLNVVPSPSLGLHLHDQEFRSCLRYWLGSLSTVPRTPALNAEESLTLSETTKLDVGEMEAELPATMRSEMFSSVLPNPQLWLPSKRLPAWCLAPAPDRQTSSFLLGAMAAQQPWMSISSLHFSSRLWLR